MFSALLPHRSVVLALSSPLASVCQQMLCSLTRFSLIYDHKQSSCTDLRTWNMLTDAKSQHYVRNRAHVALLHTSANVAGAAFLANKKK
jgi:hypothetical protein